MYRPVRQLLSGLLAFCLGGASAVARADPAAASFSVQTPRGVFECRRDASTNGLQRLSLGGQILYRQAAGSEPEETDLLRDGIVHRGAGCPQVIARNEGFVVLVRDEQAPDRARHGYLLVDFNADDPVLINLGTGQGPQDDAIPDAQRVLWEPGGMILNYIGYTPEDDPQAEPAPEKQVTLFSFAGQYAQDGRQCLRLKGLPLFGDNLEHILKADPASILPGNLKVGMSRADALAALAQFGEPYNPDDTGDGNLLTLPLCGDANDLATPLFRFKDGRLESIEFEGAE